MSKTECHSGIITKSYLSSEDCRKLVQKKYPNRTTPFYNSWESDLADEFYNEYIILNGVLYSIMDTEIDEDNTFLTKVTPYSYKYISTFYNGGTCLSEELGRALNELNNEEV